MLINLIFILHFKRTYGKAKYPAYRAYLVSSVPAHNLSVFCPLVSVPYTDVTYEL